MSSVPGAAARYSTGVGETRGGAVTSTWSGLGTRFVWRTAERRLYVCTVPTPGRGPILVVPPVALVPLPRSPWLLQQWHNGPLCILQWHVKGDAYWMGLRLGPARTRCVLWLSQHWHNCPLCDGSTKRLIHCGTSSGWTVRPG